MCCRHGQEDAPAGLLLELPLLLWRCRHDCRQGSAARQPCCGSRRPGSATAPAQTSNLFIGARQRFLDALLAAARVEVYLPNVRLLNGVQRTLAGLSQQPPLPQLPRSRGALPLLPPPPPPPPPQVELVSEGDHVSELFIVVSGQLASYRITSMWNAEARTAWGWSGCWAKRWATGGAAGASPLSSPPLPLLAGRGAGRVKRQRAWRAHPLPWRGRCLRRRGLLHGRGAARGALRGGGGLPAANRPVLVRSRGPGCRGSLPAPSH